MPILLECNQLKESFAASRDSTDPLDRDKLLTEYRAFFKRIQHNDDIRTTSEIQAVCDVNIASVALHLMAQARAGIDLPLTRAAIGWNLGHDEDTILPDTLVCTYVLRAYVDLVFEAAPLSKILAELNEALAIAYCEQSVDFLTVAAVYRLRSRVLKKIANEFYAEAEESDREATVFSALDDDYKKVIGRHDAGVNEVLRTLIGLP